MQAQGQTDALAVDVDVHDFDLDHLPGADDFARVGNELLAHRGDVHQTVLVDADVDEGAEGGDVGDRALEDHAGGEVGDFFHAFAEFRGGEFGARVAAGFVQFGDDVGDGGHAEALVGEISGAQAGKHPGVADELGDA